METKETIWIDVELDGGYPDLAGRCGWRLGVHRAPVGYQHPWLVVLPGWTGGAWSREEARVAWRAYRNSILRLRRRRADALEA
jgi:hypothetical protein